jgi:hypothetical protein
MASMKRCLEAMSADKDLVRQIRELHVQQQGEIRNWEAAGNRNIAHGHIGSIIDIVIGDVGNIVNLVDTLAGSVQGSKRFPEAAYPYTSTRTD